MSKVKIGDTVILNIEGYKQCFGTNIGYSAWANRKMKIIEVDSMSMTQPEETYMVEVDDQDINMFMIDDHCFTKV